jgi:hypothetical protein
MRSRSTICAGLLAWIALPFGPATQAQAMDGALTPDEVRAIAQEAYAWGIGPAALYELRYRVTQLESARGYAGKNRIGWNRKRIAAADREATTPSFTTLEGAGYFDLRDGPIVVIAPDVHGRYWSMQVADQYLRWYAAIGSPFTGSGAQRRLIVGPTYTGRLPLGFTGAEVIRAPSDTALVLFRIAQTRDNSDEQQEVIDLMDRITAVPLPVWEANGRRPLPAKLQATVPGNQATFPRMAEIVDLGSSATALDILQLISLVLNDPSMTRRADSAREVATLARLARIGLAEGQIFDPDTLSDEQRVAIEAGVADARRAGELAAARQELDMNGWSIGRWDVDPNDYELMSHYGGVGVLAHGPYYSHAGASLKRDAQGEPLDGANRYTLSFDVNNLPPVSEFWEIPIYDLDGYFVDNELNRYAVNSYMYRNGDFAVKDGKLTFYIQKDKPDDPVQRRNWLPAPDGGFMFAARFYGPATPLLDGSYPMPKVVRTEALAVRGAESGQEPPDPPVSATVTPY